jgi:hypothetical protein
MLQLVHGDSRPRLGNAITHAVAEAAEITRIVRTYFGLIFILALLGRMIGLDVTWFCGLL